MTPEEQALAKFVYRSIQDYATGTERSIQAQMFKVGVSDLGHCQEFTRRSILQEPLTDQDRDYSAAFIGTAVGDYVERAVLKKWPDAMRQLAINVMLETDQGTFEIAGHPDLIVVPGKHPSVIDVKTVDGLHKIAKTGPSRQQIFQRHLYGLGCWQQGLFGDIDPERIRVGNVWIDRSGREHECFANIETFSWDVVREAGTWLSDIVYAIRNDEEAQREKPREFCMNWCPRYTACRAADTDVTGLLTEPDVLAAVELHQEAAKLTKRANNMKREATNALDGITGSTGAYTVRWTHINGSHVSYERAGFDRLDVKPVAHPNKAKKTPAVETQEL